MKHIGSKLVIDHVIQNVQQSLLIDKIVVVLPDTKKDDVLSNHIVNNYKVSVFRGPEDNVLKRFLDAYYWVRTDEQNNIVRITADCPLINPQIIDRVISEHIGLNACYTSNVHPPSWPDGFDVEVFDPTLLIAQKHIAGDKEKEHVTWGMYHRFESHNVRRNGEDLSKIKLSIDTQEDYERVRNIIEKGVSVDRWL